MRKSLYGTTAMVALGLAVVAVSPVAAQAPAQGFSTSNFQISLGGYARGFVGAVGNQGIQGPEGNGVTGNSAIGSGPRLASVRSGIDQQSDFRFDINARATLPNGMTAGAVTQLALMGRHGGGAVTVNNSTATATGTSAAATAAGFGDSVWRRHWVFLQTNFGQVQLGTTDNVAFQMTQRSMDAFTAGSVANAGKIWDFIQNPTSSTPDDTPLGATNLRFWDRSSNKIAYFSPRIEGFQLGVNYTPEASADRNSEVPSAGGGIYQNGFAAALNYINTFGGIGLRASAGYVSWDAPDPFGARTVKPKDPYAFNFGLGVTYMGFDLGGSYAQYKNGLSMQRGNYLTGGAFAGLVNNGSTASGTSITVDGRAWEIGLGYTMGPARMSVNYFNGENEAASVTNVNNVLTTTYAPFGAEKRTGVALNGAYTMGPGVNLEASLFSIRQEANRTGSGVPNGKRDNSAIGVVTGLILAF